MPLYIYHCEACNRVVEEFQHIRDEAYTECPECNDPTYHRVPTMPHTDLKEFYKPIEMQSLGLAHPEDIAAFKRRHPDVDMADDPNHPLYGVPIARTRKQKLDILKGEGWEERN